MPWTNEQRAAIAENGNLIVSAAAGAGKTAVLTERIASRILSGTPVESLLVLTFTRAAAAEMKARISARLTAAADEATGAEAKRLRAEASRVGAAHISTVHAFCARVLKRHAHRLGLPPNMRIADELETAALSEQAKDALLSALSAEENPDWLRLLTAFGGEEPAWAAVLETARFLESEPDPDAWLSEAVNRYASHAGIEAQLSSVLSGCKSELRLVVSALSEARDTLPPDWAMVIGVLDDDILRCRAQLLAKDYDGYRQGLCDFAFQTLRFPKGTEDRDKAPVRALREMGKDLIKEQRARLSRPFAEECAAMQRAGIVLFALQHVVSAYRAAFLEAKRKKGVLDYADLEHDALSLLSLPDVAAEYREKFSYIAIDEYQDSNRVQDAILSRIRRENNLFFVGDVKQSIYRFRQAAPALFLEKLASFTGSAGKRIDLNRNFRSKPAVLDAVNGVFSRLMTVDAGELDYDERAMLIPGTAASGGGAELHIIERGGEAPSPDETELETAADAEVEARFVAERIRSIMATETIDEPGAPALRAPAYADFAVLLRSTTHAQRFAETLSRSGIPCYASVNGGYFDALEVQIFLNLLRVIDNRRQDVPLISVLLSTIGDFTPKELLTIRTAHKEGSFFSAFAAAAAPDTTLDPALSARVADFLMMLAQNQRESLLVPAEQLIGRLLDETGFYEEMGASYGGARRQANLDALLSRAQAFEATGARGLSAFLRQIDLARSGASFGSAETLSANVVRILTIHKSKGLEFPYVFVSQLGARFPTGGGKSNPALQLHGAAGIAVRIEQKGVQYDTVLRKSIVRRLAREQLSEEMRVLYVAMTRAKNRLILVGCQRNAAEKVDAPRPAPSPLAVLSAGTPLEWLLMGKRSTLPVTVHTRREYLAGEVQNAAPALPKADPAIVAAVASRFAWAYPYKEAVRLPSKAAVSRVSGGVDGMPARLPDFDVPAFLPDAKKSGAFLGTAVHAALQHLPLDGSVGEAMLSAYLDGLLARGRLTEEQRAAVSPGLLGWFLSHPLFARMQSSPRVERELAFGYEVDASAVFDTTAEERVLLQGVIDCCFIEDGAWVLVDYKTDRPAPGVSATEAAARHAPQLRLYASALSGLSGLPVAEQYVVLLSYGMAVKL